MEFLRKWALPVVAVVLVFHFVLSLTVSSQESMTFDEKAHIPSSYSYVRYGDMRLNPEHPPLLKDLAGLFLLPLNLTFPLESPEWQNGINEQWVVGDMFVNCLRPELTCNDSDTILFFSRIPITLVAVLLGVFLFFWTKELGGTLAGVFAVILYAFDPNVIAHNHYVTTDLGSAAFIFFAFYFFVRFLRSPNKSTIFLAGLFLGLAELAKFSAVLLFPLFGLFAFVFALTRKQPETDTRKRWRFKIAMLFRYLLGYTGSVMVCFLLIWIVYAANTYAMPGEKLVALADFFLHQSNPFAQAAHAVVVNLSHSPVLKPMSEYFLGVFMVFTRVAAGNVHYFLGTVTDAASPWYFPVVFFLKETLPFLFLLLVSTFSGLYHMLRFVLEKKGQSLSAMISRSFQVYTAQYLSVFFILFYSYISITGNLNIGFRHLFPILPFLYMLLGKWLADFYKGFKNNPTTQHTMNILIGCFLITVVAIPLLSYPSYLSYFNALAGGHSKGYLYVTDSNYDWGQDLKHLKNFVDQYNSCAESKSPSACLHSQLGLDYLAAKSLPNGTIDKIRVDYFGGGSPSYYLGQAFTSWWGGREPEAGWYAISSFFYQESLYKKLEPGERNYEWLTHFTPLTRAGDSFFIYYIPEEALK